MRFLRVAAVIAIAFGPGCTVLVDGALAGRGAADAGIDGALPPIDANLPDTNSDTGPPVDAGNDSGVPSACSGLPDGVQCSVSPSILDPFVCIRGVCTLSRCGDGAPDTRVSALHAAEQCDDGNDSSGDGCESDCTFSCEGAGDCVSADSCTTLTCNATMHLCESMMLDNDTACMILGGGVGACRGGVCVSSTCGDGTIVAPEQCEDMNTTPGDGCENDCTFSCESSADCDDANPCNGAETCGSSHACVPGTDVTCADDGNACTIESCSSADGSCVTDVRTHDVDADGHYATACGGDDCNDADGNVFPGAPEVCNGGVDDDCDPATTEGAPTTYYADCDNDSYAPTGAETMSSCGAPTVAPACGGRWVSRTGDCDDDEPLAHPGQTHFFTAPYGRDSYDYDCNRTEEREYLYSTTPPACTYLRLTCTGDPYYASRPSCGAANILGTCALSGSTCTRRGSTTTVACR